MFKKRTMSVVVGAVAAALVLAGCTSSGGGTEAGGDGEKPYIALVSKGFQHQF